MAVINWGHEACLNVGIVWAINTSFGCGVITSREAINANVEISAETILVSLWECLKTTVC